MVNWVSSSMDKIAKGKTFIKDKFDSKILGMLSYLEIGLSFEEITVTIGKELKVIKVPSWKDYPLVGQYRHIMKEEATLEGLTELLKQLTVLDKLMVDFPVVHKVFKSKNPNVKLPVDLGVMDEFDKALKGEKMRSTVLSQDEVNSLLFAVASGEVPDAKSADSKLKAFREELRNHKPSDNVLSQAEVDRLLKSVKEK